MWELLCLLITSGLCVNVQSIDDKVKVVNTDRIIFNASSGFPHEAHTKYTSSEKDEDLKNVVVTERGSVRGFEKDGILQFFDIPYGAFSADKPFQEPIVPAQWSHIQEKTEHKSRCPQINADNKYVGDHECLTLSIFKTYVPENDENGKYATNTETADVLFHIHDSAFASGSGDPTIYIADNLVSKGIILVLPNYRVGPLGFLCLQNETAPGNAGLKDLTLALKWTRRNIGAFGGNSSNIVISGAGAGGALVEYLLLSNMSRSYISKAIIESGFSISPWAVDRNPLATANSLFDSIARIKKIDQYISYEVLDQLDLEVLVRGAVNHNFKPCVEKETGFITETPWQSLQTQGFNFAFMSGSTNQAAMVKALGHTEGTLSQLNGDLTLLLPNDLIFENNEDRLRIGTQVKTLYFGERNITLANINQLSQCYSDSEYLNPGIRTARLLVKGGASVHFYEFSFNNPKLHRNFNGSIRGDTLALVFSKKGSTDDVEELRVRNILSNLWVSFIKTGKPTAYNVAWNTMKEVPPAEEEWLSISTEVRMEKGLHLDRLNLWREIYEKHFIENNLGFVHKPSIYILIFSLSVLVQLGVVKPWIRVF